MNELVLVLIVAVAGGVGSALRYVVDHSLPAPVRERYPWGTMLVNLTGSFLLGLVTGLAPAGPWGVVVATGLLGGYTTFSTASLESVRLLTEKRWAAALAHGPGMLVACTTLAVGGLLLTTR